MFRLRNIRTRHRAKLSNSLFLRPIWTICLRQIRERGNTRPIVKLLFKFLCLLDILHEF